MRDAAGHNGNSGLLKGKVKQVVFINDTVCPSGMKLVHLNKSNNKIISFIVMDRSSLMY